jgi:hypothetical protein
MIATNDRGKEKEGSSRLYALRVSRERARQTKHGQRDNRPLTGAQNWKRKSDDFLRTGEEKKLRPSLAGQQEIFNRLG